MKRWFLFMPLVLFLLLAVLFFGGLFTDKEQLPSALLDEPVPTFKLKRLDTQKLVTLSSLPKEVFLLNVWATWCIACRAEHGQLLHIAHSGVPVIGLNYKDNRQKAINFLEHLKNPYQFSIADPDGILGFDLGVYGAPETFVIDGSGVIRYRHVGMLTSDFWQQTIYPLVKQLSGERGSES